MQAALRGWLALQTVAVLRPVEARRALEAARGPWRALTALGLAPPDRATLESGVAALRATGARLLRLGSPAYPERLARLPDAAAVLFVRGDARVLTRAGVAIVGSRAATRSGQRSAESLGADLARAGLVVVSGLARGIDAAAHRGALAGGGLTVAVQACGPDRVYPAGHRGLAEAIAARGAVITEFPPGAPPAPNHFPLRNRLISGLARALVVVEARRRSGSLITAGHAAEQGVDVLAVPGPVDAVPWAGSNLLLRHGAAPALDADDVLAALRLPPRPRERRPRRPRRETLPLPARRILDALEREPATRDELARCLGDPPESLALLLVELELVGAIREERDGRLHAEG